MNSSYRVYPAIRQKVYVCAFRRILILLPTILLLQACSNSFKLNPIAANGISAAPPNTGTNTGSINTFTLSRVVKNTTNPTSVLDLIGDGSGTLGALCVSASGNTSPTANDNVCQCSFDYSTSTAPNQHRYVPITYYESNLLRCAYTAVPSDTINLSVKINLKTVDANSNSVTINLSSTSGATLDVTNPTSFLKAIRYQCRDLVVIKYLFDTTVYDPFQSEDPHLTYPIDFYATNLGDAISQYIGSKQSFWNCPAILNPVENLTPIALSLFNSTNHINLNIYSKAPLPGGGKLIYPPNGSVDRSTFYVAKQASGVFSVPVNAMLAPGVVTALGGTGAQPLGFGAHPIPLGVGTGQETCDPSVTLPPGFKWGKLWLFRAGLAQRHYATAGSNGPSISQLASMTCNPGDWTQDTSPHSPIFPQCYQDLTNNRSDRFTVGLETFLKGSRTMAKDSITSGHYLADRVLGSGQCIRFDDNSGAAAVCPGPSPTPGCYNNPPADKATYCGTHPGPGCSDSSSLYNGIPFGDDRWVPEAPYTTASSTPSGCSANPLIDPMGLCTASPPENNYGPVKTPRSFNVGTGDLDTATGNSGGAARFDFLFVVTPPNINTIDMQDTSPSSTSLPYQPYRFLTDEDCNSPDPDSSPPGTCLINNAINNFGLKLHDVGTNGDPPGDDPTNLPIYPICVLQPDGS